MALAAAAMNCLSKKEFELRVMMIIQSFVQEVENSRNQSRQSAKPIRQTNPSNQQARQPASKRASDALECSSGTERMALRAFREPGWSPKICAKEGIPIQRWSRSVVANVDGEGRRRQDCLCGDSGQQMDGRSFWRRHGMVD